MKPIAFAAAAACVLFSSPAIAAGQLFAALAPSDCASGVVSTDIFVDRLRFGYDFDPPPGQLGDVARDAAAECFGNEECATQRRRLANLYRDTTDMFGSLPEYSETGRNFVAIMGRSTETASDRARSLLNTRQGDLVVRCIAAQRPPAETNNIVVGRSSKDAGRRRLQDREFAQIALTDDRSADRETTAIDLFIGYRNPHWGRSTETIDWGISPFVALQKIEIDQATPAAKEVDDLTFGLSAPIYLYDNGLQHVIQLDAEWETDTGFESGVTTARISWMPYINETLPCLNRYSAQRSEAGVVTRFSRLGCSFNLVAEYVEVGDPGEKAALQTVDQYARAGFDVSFDYDVPVGEGAILNLGVGYALRESFTEDEDGDADLISAEISWLPSETSHFSFGIEYRHGEDLTSLDAQETTMLRFGYRR